MNSFTRRFKEYGLRWEALTTCYAMAENVFAVTQGEIGKPARVDPVDREVLQREGRAVPSNRNDGTLRLLSAGKPIRNTHVRILDEDGSDAPERTIGEIALQGDCLLSSYYHREDLTHGAFLDGWYLTGDLGYMTDGELFVTGRRKEIIIVGGKNIYPQDLEYLVGEVDGVHPGRVVAFGLFNERQGTEDIVLVAEVEPRARMREPSWPARFERSSPRARMWLPATLRRWIAGGSSRPAAARSPAGPIGRNTSTRSWAQGNVPMSMACMMTCIRLVLFSKGFQHEAS